MLKSTSILPAPYVIDIHSRSIAPIFRGNDTADRCIIAEIFGLNVVNDGRALIMDDWPDYKLISVQDVTDPDDIPSYQMSELGSNGGVAATWDTGDITDGGTTTSAARVDELGDPDRYSVVASFDVGNFGLTRGVSYPIVVTFPGGMGDRVFTATNQFTVP